jgi:hypothetical protein
MMTLLIESFFLSFKTFLRYLVVMPFVVIPGFLILMTIFLTPVLLSQGFILIIFLFAPVFFATLIGLIFGFLLTAMTSFNIMIGCRAAFGAMGRFNDLDFGRLVGKSFVFTLAQMAAGVFIVLILGGIVAATVLLGAGTSLVAPGPDITPLFLLDFMTSHPLTIGLGLLSLLLSLSLSALLAVPMAGAAISATPKMGPTDAFIGLGAGFLPLLSLLIIVSVGLTVSGSYSALIIVLTKLATTFAQYLGNLPLVWPTPQETLFGVAMFLFIVWTSCWFYAAAALGWKGHSDDRDASLAQKVESERFSPDDLRAFRELRDRQRNAMV